MYSGLQESKSTLQTFKDTIKPPALYWNRMELAYKIFRFMGYIPYKISDESDKIELSPQTWLWVGFASLVQVVIVGINDYIIYCEDKYWDTYDDTLESLLILLNTNNVIFILVTLWESKKIIQYINSWSIVLSKLEKITFTGVTCFPRSKLNKILMLSAVITMTAILLYQFTLQKTINPFLTFSFFINVYVSALFTTFWAANCLFIVQVTRCFKHNFFLLLQIKCDPTLIDKHRLLWIDLRHNIANLAESFKGTVGLLIFINLLCLIFSTYTWMAAALYTKNINHVIGLTVPVVWHTLILMSICEFSDMVSREIGQKFISKMLSLNLSTQRYALITPEVIDSFFDTLDANSPDFVLHGCLTLNRRLPINILSSIVTYIFVLLQFESSGTN